MNESLPKNEQPKDIASEVPNSFANAWNNLVPKKIPPIVDNKILEEETNKKIIWKNFTFKYLWETFNNFPLRFKLIVFALGMILLAILTFLILAYIGYNATQNLKSLEKNPELIESNSAFNSNPFSPVFPSILEIKDQESPLNGELFTPSEIKNFIGTRPYAVTIDNAEFARAQMSGLISADLVYEFPTERFTNRFLGIFWSRKPNIIGPVRSIRTYMMDILPDTDAILSHFGQSAPDPNKTYREKESIAVDSALYFSNYSVDHTECSVSQDKSLIDLGIPTEHTYFTNISSLGDCIPAGWVRNPTISNYLFKSDIESSLRPVISEMSISIGTNSPFSSRWIYDPSKNIYNRYQNGAIHKERELGGISAKNLIIQYLKISEISDPLDHLNFTMIGEGDAIILFDGKVIRGRWVKPSRNERTKYYNQSGEEVRFNRGKFWISIVPTESGSAFNYDIGFK